MAAVQSPSWSPGRFQVAGAPPRGRRTWTTARQPPGQQRAARSQALADWIETNRQALIQSGKQGTASAGQTARGGEPTIGQITSSAAQFGITLSRLQPESDGSVSVAVEQQLFNALVQWLAGIESEQGYVIDRASIDRASEEGLVNGQFRFR